MAMQIQRGLVKYKDRSDIICTYGVNDAGVQYYFLDEAKLPNGNIIVTTTLLEAVDSVAVASHVGLIDEFGNEVIPCENKSIKTISSDILLVERAQPVSESVLEAVRLKDDPNYATKLVTTTAAIKDNINNIMGENGRFVFDDQFSEATIVDMNGNNLANGEYYSFIGVNDKKIYFSKNVEGSEVSEYSLYPVNDDLEGKEVPPTLNVETTDVTVDAIDKAINEELGGENTATDVEPIAPNNLENEEVVENNQEEVVEENTIQDTDNNEVTEEVPVEDSNGDTDESVEEVSEVPKESDEVTEEVNETAEDSNEDDDIKLNINIDEDNNQEDEKDEEEEKETESNEEPLQEDEEEYDDYNNASSLDDTDVSEKYDEEEDVDNITKSNEPLYVEDEYDYDDMGYNNLVESYDFGAKNNNLPQRNLFDDVTVTISNLVELNRNLQAMVNDNDMKLAKSESARKKLVELSKSQAREISSLNARVARLESEKQVLENKLEALKPSSNGELVRAMADAQNIIGQSNNLLRRKNNY